MSFFSLLRTAFAINFSFVFLFQIAQATTCQQGISSVDLAFPIEGSPSAYEVFLGYGVPWKNDEGHYWGQTTHKHLGIDIKLISEASTNTSDGASPNITKNRKIYAAYDGLACYGDAGGSGNQWWGNYIAIRHSVNGFVFYTLYFHIIPESGLNLPSMGGGDCSNGLPVLRRQPLGAPHDDTPDPTLAIAKILDLDNAAVHDRDHLHFAISCDDVTNGKCGGGSSSHMSSNGGKCINPTPFFPEIKFEFPDVDPEVWFAEPVYKLVKTGDIKGHADGTFKPDNQITRAEFTAFLVRAKNVECLPDWSNCPQDIPYLDVSPQDWHYPLIRAAYNQNYSQNNHWIPNTPLFRPNENIIRGEMTDLIMKVLGKEGQQPPQPNPLFADVTDPNDWYYNSIYLLQSSQIVQGYAVSNTVKAPCDPSPSPIGPYLPYFCPLISMNRAEASKVVCKAVGRCS